MSAVLRPVSGEGVLARQGDLVLLLSAPPGSDELVAGLLAAQEEVARSGADGMALTDRLGAVLAASPSTVDMVAFGPSGAGLAIVVYGVAFADVATAQGQQRLAVSRPRDGVRNVLPGALASVRAGLGDPAAAREPQRFGQLDHGVVQAAGLLLTVDGVSVPPPPPAAMPFTPQGAPESSGAAATAAPAPGPSPAPAEPSTAPPAVSPEPVTEPAPVPPPPPAVTAAGDDAVLAPDAPPAPLSELPADAPGIDLLAKDLATGGAHEPSVPDAEPAVGLGAPQGAAPQDEPAVQTMAMPAVEPAADEIPLLLAKPDAPDEQALLGAPPAPPVADVDRSMPFEAVSLLAPLPGASDEPPVPLPVAQPLAPAAPDVAPAPHPAPAGAVQVMGVYCKNGHFDDPSARYCAVCGISMAQQTLIPRLGPRPPLGVLVLDDGSIFSLDKDYVIGRDPGRDPDVQRGTANPLRLDDPHGQLSRVHLRIHLEGWQVEVVDLGSANGTGVWRPGDTQWTRVPPQTRIPIRPGTQVGFGRNQLRFESHTNT